MTKAQPNIHIPSHYTPQMTMIIPGRRALGETFTKVELGVMDDKIVAHVEPADAPASGQTVAVMHGKDAKYASYIMQAMDEKQRTALAKGELGAEEKRRIAYDALNKLWFDHMEQKKLWLAGTSQSGPTGLHQRQKTHQNPDTRPAHQ